MLGIRTTCQSSSFWLHSHAKVMNHHFIHAHHRLLVSMSLGMMECMNQHGIKMDSSLWTSEPRSLWCTWIKWWFVTLAWECNQKLDDWHMVRILSITADRIQGVRRCSISGWKRLQVYFWAHQTVHYLDVPIRSYAHFSNCCQKLKRCANQPLNSLEHAQNIMGRIKIKVSK